MSQTTDSESFGRDSQSQFISQEGDEDVLWEVIEITAEKGGFYKVRWAGLDPKTNKPWAQSWVRKPDCTDDLVHEWKRKRSKKKRKGSKGSRLSHVSGTSRVSTNASSSVAKHNIRDQRTTVASVNRAKDNRKRTRSAAPSDEGYNEDDVNPPLVHPKKKRKINGENSKATQARQTMRKGSRVQESDNEYVYESEVLTNRPRYQEKSKVLPVKTAEDESSSDEGTARIQPASSIVRKPSTIKRNAKPRRPSNTRTPTVTPDYDTAYVRYHSGKLSTPRKMRRSPGSAEDLSSSSDDVDEVDEVVSAHKSRTPPPVRPKASLPTTPSTNLRHLEVYRTPSVSDPHNDEDQIVREMYDEYVDFDAVHQQPSKGIRVSATSNGAKDDSYRQGEIPETETESSRNTQSQSQSQSMLPAPKQRQRIPPLRSPSTSSPEVEHPEPSSKPAKQWAPKKPSRAPTLILPSQTPPPRSSIISSPCTPGSNSRISLSDDDGTFHQPELEMHMGVEDEQHEPDAAETRTEQQKPASSSSSRRASRAGYVPLRPIPKLSPSVFAPHLLNVLSASNHRSAADTVAGEDPDEEEVTELVSSIEQFTSPEKGRRKQKIGQDRVDCKETDEEPANGHTGAEGSVTDGDDSSVDELEDVVQQRGQQLAGRARAEKLKRQRELDGKMEAGKKKTLTKLLSENVEKGKKRRREAEFGKEKGERTKPTLGPLWEEKEKERKLRSSRSPLEDAEHEEDYITGLREEEEESTQDLIMDVPDRRPMEDVELNQSWDVEPSALVTKELPSKDELILPPTAPLPSSTSIEEQDNRPDFVATLALLDEKSQENAQLTKEINALREALAAASAPRPREIELEQELGVLRASLEAVQASFAASEKRAAELARGKETAENDREFFREHYAQASGFVTSVREENAELQKEAQIAREQALIGVEAVKATYAARVKALEDDARTYKRLALFVVEKDIRTNDDIRRRAGEEPELRARCEELAKESRELRNVIVELQEEVDDKELKLNELEQLLRSWKRQATVLNTDLNKLKSTQEGEDKVYQCGWRVDDDANVPCDQVFMTYEDFERHMFSDRHLDAKRAGLYYGECPKRVKASKRLVVISSAPDIEAEKDETRFERLVS